MIGLVMEMLARLVRGGAEAGEERPAERWRRDPLSHPALAAMDQVQLGDLPWRPAGGCGQ